jgi:hypothetical protein
MAKVEVIATALGFDGIMLRDVGTKFLMDEKYLAKATWFAPVKGNKDGDKGLGAKTVAELKEILRIKGVEAPKGAGKDALISMVEEVAAASDEDEDLA